MEDRQNEPQQGSETPRRGDLLADLRKGVHGLDGWRLAIALGKSKAAAAGTPSSGESD